MTKTTKSKVKKTTTKPKTAKKIIKKKAIKPQTEPAWEVALSVINPANKRPRRTSLHTLATVIGAKDPLDLAKEMQKSGKVVGYVCPDVQTPIFYLKELANLPGMIDTRDSSVWGNWHYPDAGATSLKDFFDKNPYPRIKGFKRFANSKGHWTGGGYGLGKYILENKSGMEKPYEPADYNYARGVIKALKKAGYKPGISEKDLK